MKKSLITIALFAICSITIAQDTYNLTLGKGIKFEDDDKTFSMQFNLRSQILYEGFYTPNQSEYIDRFSIRRARFKFKGYAVTSKLTYKMELGLSNRDHGGGNIVETNNTANIILDAFIMWNFYKNFSLMAGQGKLPGNRQRIISSQALEFVDRSYLNSRFTLDRDIGVQLHHHFKAGKMLFREQFSISQGEGRGIVTKNNGGYDFTGRVEWLPMGSFSNNGDYFEADLEREQTPKFSLGLAFDTNRRALRERGQKGDFLDQPTDLQTYFVDGIFKYKGHSVLFEYSHKVAPKGAIVEIDTAVNELEALFFTGNGVNVQYSYVFPSNFHLGGRFTRVVPKDELIMEGNEPALELGNPLDQYTLGISKFLSGHTVKIQSDITYITQANIENSWLFRLQFEIGI